MGRNARRTHNLKNKRGARRDEGGGGARRWSSGESEREREDGGGNGASLCPVSRLVCTSSRSARGVEGGTYPAPRGGVKRARGWAGGAVGSRSGEERRWMYRTVNETMPLTTFGTDNGRECAAGVNEPKVVHRWVGSSPLPRHGWGWVGLARLAIIASTIDLIALRDSPLVPSLSLFVSVPFFSPLPFRLLATRGLLIRPQLHGTCLYICISVLSTSAFVPPFKIFEDEGRGIGIFGQIVSFELTIFLLFFFFPIWNSTEREERTLTSSALHPSALSPLVAVVVPFASQPVPTFATRSLLPDVVPLRLVSVRVLFLRASVHTFAHAFSSARLPRHPSSSLKRFFPLRGGGGGSSPRFSSPPTYLPVSLHACRPRAGGGIRVYTRVHQRWRR